MKTKKLKTKWIDCAVVLGIVFLFYFFDIPCLFKTLFSVPCPGCGMTRAYVSLLHFDLQKAWEFHPMFWSVPLWILLYFTDGKLFKINRLNILLIAMLSVGFLLNWIYQLLTL